MVQWSKNVTFTLFYYISWDSSVTCHYPGVPRRLYFLCFYQCYCYTPFCHRFHFALLAFGFPLKSGWKSSILWCLSCCFSVSVLVFVASRAVRVGTGTSALGARGDRAFNPQKHICKLQSSHQIGLLVVENDLQTSPVQLLAVRSYTTISD